MLRFCAVSVIAVMLAGPALAGEKKPVDPNRKICRRDVGTTGSIMPKTVCHTADEWKAIDRANQATVDQMNQQRTTSQN